MNRTRVGEVLRLNVSVRLWFVLVIAVLAVVAAYFCAPQYREEVKFCTVVVGGAAAIYSAYYVGAALRLKIERDRQEASFCILQQIDRPEFVKVRNFVAKEVQDYENLSAADLYNKISQNQELDDAVTTVFNTLEGISVGIQHGFMDENVLYQNLVSMVLRDYNALRGYIDQLRKEGKCTSYFIELEKLAQAWHSRKRLSDGKVLPDLEK